VADKQVTVRLRAVVDEYKRAMDSAAKSTDGVTRKGKDFTALGAEAGKLGGVLTRNVTLPLLAVGAASGKMAYDFEGTFARMQGLAGVASSEIDGLKDSVLDLAGDTARAPQDVAEGLYFIRSAGLAGATAMEALEVSAKGATAGLGTTAAVADAVTSAINAYGEANITAAEAGDVLAATAREGKAEASELAPQFGRLLPIAAELGVTFDEVGAGMAFLSRSSGDAALSATQLNGVLTKIIEPGEEGAEALEAIGSSGEALRKSVREKGLLPTLIELRKNLEANGLSLNDFSRDQQFLQGALQLTGVQADEAAKVFENLEQSTGSLGGAFGAVAGTDGFAMKQALAEVQVAMIKLGDVILPLAAAVAQFGAMALTALSSLPGPLDTVVVGFLALLFAAGPLLKMAGPLVKAWKLLGDMAAALGPKMGVSAEGMAELGKAGRAMAALGGIAALAAVGFEVWGNMMAEAQRKGEEVAESLKGKFGPDGPVSMQQLREGIRGLNGDIDDLTDNISGSQAPWDFDRQADWEGMRDGARATRDEWNELEDAAVALAEKMGITEDEALQNILGNEELAASAVETGGAFDVETASVIAATEALQGYADRLTATYDPVFAMQDALAAEAEAQAAVTTAVKEHGAGSEEAIAAEEALFRAVVASDGAALGLAAAMKESGQSTEDMAADLDSWVESGRLTREQADKIAWGLGIAIGKGEDFAGTYSANLEAQDNATPLIDTLMWKLGQIAGTYVANIGVTGTSGWYFPGSEDGGLVGAGSRRRPGPTDTVPMMLAPGEYVVKASAVAAVGVPALEALNAGRPLPAMGSSRGPVFQQSGAGGSVTHIHHYAIHAQSIAEHHLGRTVRDALESAERRGITAA
jgi:TP901 family phage tail tape measure protein